jgi:type I restriction enzyme S subunit
MKEYPAFYPSKPEQQKIADCLASLDERITLEAQKLATLKTHKKGLMQQLFPATTPPLRGTPPAEGNDSPSPKGWQAQPDGVVPKLRFPEFQDAGAWDERELGPLTIKVGSGITPTGGDKNYKTKGRPFVRSQNVGWGELILNDVAFIDEETHQSFGSTEIKVSDVLLNITGASIGRSAVADSRIVGGNVNQHVCIIRAKQEELNPALLNHFLISERGQNQIDSFQAGGNRQGLNFAQIRTFVIPLPPTENEQRRIADCLGTLDDLITAQTQQLAALKTHKKGLMQQLFPALEEVAA